MSQIIKRRMRATIDGDFVVFLIGMRVNAWWKVHKWFPPFVDMFNLLKELERTPSDRTGYLGHMILGTGVIVQYWRSFDHLVAYANSRSHGHLPAWARFNKRMKGAAGDVGVWHETYLVQSGAYENLYIGMPPWGLGRAGNLEEISAGGHTARERRTSEEVTS